MILLSLFRTSRFFGFLLTALMLCLTSLAVQAAPAAPTSLSVSMTKTSSTGHDYFFSWTDNATDETSFVINYRIGTTGSFASFSSVTSSTPSSTGGTSVSFSGVTALATGTIIQFQVAASNASGTSAFSNTFQITIPTDAFVAPGSPALTATSESVLTASWTDLSSQETGEELEFSSDGGTTFNKLGDILYYQTRSINITGLSPGTSYKIRLRAYKEGTPRTYTAYSTVATGTTKDGFTSTPYIEFGTNNAYSYQATTSTASARTAWNAASGLPTGMTFSTSTGAITGTPTQYGLFNATLSATFANGWTSTLALKVRVVRPPASPVTATTIASQTLTAGGNTSISLTDKFSDPDSESAVRLVTNVGTMDFILYNTATPQTVTNFLSYVNGVTNNYNGSVFHRAVAGFIVQGGAFKVASAPNNFSVTPTSASPTNEPGISNLRGTVAMAKVSGDPNSATDQFFVNIANNSSNLDNQNGGFTAFARVAGNGLAVADAIAALPQSTYNVNLGSTNTNMDNWPLTSSSGSMDTTKVVSITSAAPVAVLSYSVTGNTNPAVATATISGTNVQINALAGGTTSVTVTATDLDGNTVSQTVPVTVNQAPAFTNGPPTTTGVVNTVYSFTCTASGYPAPTFTKTAGTLPTGLTLTTAGVLSGTPTVTGTFTGTITASNGIGTAATQNYSITVNSLPAFTSAAPTTTGVVGTAYSFTCLATGVPAPTFSVTAGALPPPLTISSAGVISGTPNASGIYTGTITASNAAGSIGQPFSITVNQSPAFTNGPPTTIGVVSSLYSFTCTASGYPAPTFTKTAGTLPTGLTLTTAGVLSGTPTVTGTFTGTITASNGIGTAATQNYSITVNSLPAFTSAAPTTTGVVGTAYSFTCLATGVPAPTFSVTAGALPPPLTISSAGVISGTPNASGIYTGTITASNAAGSIGQPFSITVNQAPAFTSAAPTTPSLANQSYSFTCTASGYPAPTFSVTAGALPTGLSISSGGAITGTPTATGVFTGTITASNGIGTAATQNFSITINQAPAFTSAAPTSSSLLNTAYSFTCTASGYPAPTFSVPANTLPTGLTLNPSSGAITGTPTATGVFTGTITASNGIGTAATQNFSITINQAPAFTSSAPTSTGSAGTAYNFTCTASGYPPPTFSRTAGSLPTGLTLSNAGVISGTPSAAGTFTGTITASNGIGTAATQNFSITINATLSNWASGYNLSGSDALPSADPDHDGHTNLEEFAFMTDPTIANTTAVPSYVLAAPGATKFGEITFPVRKLAPSLTYTVEASTDLVSDSWTTLWTSADGFSASVVSLAVDQSDRTVLTVRDTQASPPATRRFLRVKILQP